MPEPVDIHSLKRADEVAESVTDRVLVECFTALCMELAETNEMLSKLHMLMQRSHDYAISKDEALAKLHVDVVKLE